MSCSDAEDGKARRELAVGTFTPSELAVGRGLERHCQRLHREPPLRRSGVQAGGWATPARPGLRAQWTGSRLPDRGRGLDADHVMKTQGANAVTIVRVAAISGIGG